METIYKMKKKIFRWVKVIALLYALIGIAFYYLQDRLLFHPEPVDRQAKYHFDQSPPFTEVNLPYNKETNLNVIQFRVNAADSADEMGLRHNGEQVDSSGGTAGNSARLTGRIGAKTASVAEAAASIGGNGGYRRDSAVKGVVLYFHGNKRNIGWYARHATDFTHRGYEVWMLDYPGFGKSTGPRNEAQLYAYALQLYKLARSRYKPSEIIIYGKSMGTGIAAQLASVRNCKRLILECPYYSMTSLVRHYMPVWPVATMLHYHFPTNEFLPAVTDPVTIIHGASDGLIPIGNARKLQPLLKPGDEFISIEGGGHNDLSSFPAYQRELDSLLMR